MSNRKKVVSGVVALGCVLALLLAGTFAWQASTSAVNSFSGLQEVREPREQVGGNLHDNFRRLTGEKEVFVENTGEEPIYVRIKLQEFLDTTSDQEPGGIPNWVTYIPGDVDTDGWGGHANTWDDAFAWQMGNAEPRFVRTIVGSSAWISAGGLRINRDRLVGDAFGDTVTEAKATTNSNAVRTIQATQVIKMDEYTAKTPSEKAGFVGWVYDTDGYAYWSQKLLGGRMTGLLLDSVSAQPFNETFYYAINVVMEYVDAVDLPAWFDGDETLQEGSNAGQTTEEASAQAQALLQIAGETNWEQYHRVGATFIASGYEWIVIALDDDGNALVTTRDVVGMAQFNATTNNNYVGSNLERIMNDFYGTLVYYDRVPGPDEAKITEVAQPSDFATAISSYEDREDETQGLSRVDDGGEVSTFALSWQELLLYTQENPDWRLGRRLPGPIPVITGLSALSGSAVHTYWLRTPGSVASQGAGVNTVGDIVLHPSHSSLGVRPALWIKLQ